MLAGLMEKFLFVGKNHIIRVYEKNSGKEIKSFPGN